MHILWHILFVYMSIIILHAQSRDVSEFLDELEIKREHNANINFINSQILEQTTNFTMIQLANNKIVYVVTAKVENWTNTDVCKWLNSISSGIYQKFIPKFKERKTTGFDLLNLSRVQLQNNIGMHSPNLRNRLLKEIKILKHATKPSPSKLLQKRSSAINFDEIKKMKRPSGHRRSASNLGMQGRSKSHETYKPIPRKLGPRDIGRASYKGTNWDHDLFKFDFLEEKINYNAKSAQFNKRKRQNPVMHKETVDEIGISRDFETPDFVDDVLLDMKKSSGWLADKPMSRRNADLDKLKGAKVAKHERDKSRPIGWKPIEYEYKRDGKEFLEEHFWFDGSGVQFEFGFSRLLNCLSPAKQLKLNKMESPTGYETKLNWFV